MSNSGSDGHLKAFLGIVIFTALLGVIIFQKSDYQHVIPVSNVYDTSEYKERATSRIGNECSTLDGFAKLKCANDIEQSTRDAHRAQKDLKAQRYMAMWAFVMAIGAVLGLLVTFIGLVFIKQTLDATRDTLKATREIGMAQVRAYLSLEIKEVNIAPVKVDGEWLLKAEINCEIVNRGNSPAFRMRVRYDIAARGAGERFSARNDGDGLFETGTSVQSIAAGNNHKTMLKRTFKTDLAALKAGTKEVGLSYALVFEDVFGVELFLPLQSGVFREYPPKSGNLVFASANIEGTNPDVYGNQ